MGFYPFCSVIVLNYFGEKVLEQTLNSLLKLDYPEDKYEILVVDNNSQDKSRNILERFAENHKLIKPIFLDKNYGFAKGNNFGIKKSKGEYVALLNNDCTVNKEWLKELVKSAIKDDKIFAVNSKILLYPKYIKVKFSVDPKLVPVYAWLSDSCLHAYSGSQLIYLPLWKKHNKIQKEANFVAEISYDPYRDKFVVFTLLFSLRGAKSNQTTSFKDSITFENHLIKVTNIKVKGDDVEFQISVDLSNLAILKDSLDKIQNAGIMVFQDGYGRDIGAIVKEGQQSYEYDLKQYDKERPVYAACGAAVLYNKKILDSIGLLDETFFMYYEDVEICERARFAGFKTIYNPKAVVRHYHALSSKEGSSFFTYQAEKGRLLHIFYNFPFRVFLREYLYLFFLNLALLFSLTLRFRELSRAVKSRKQPAGQARYIRRIQIIKALAYFLFNSPVLFLKRLDYSQKRPSQAVNKNYQQLLSGVWYFQ